MNFAIVDIEATDLKADKGFMLCCGIKPLGKKGTVIGLKETGVCSDPLKRDSKLVEAVYDAMMCFDGWITWYGKGFDMPFINDRLLICGKGKKVLRDRYHIDVMWQFGPFKSCLTRRSLDWVARKLQVNVTKTHLDLDIWLRAKAEVEASGLKVHKNYDYIETHCAKDLIVTEQVYEKAKPRIKAISRC